MTTYPTIQQAQAHPGVVHVHRLADDEWVAYEAGDDLPAQPIDNGVPQEVTRRQAKQAIALAGLLSNVQPAIDAIQDATQRTLMQIEWDDAQTFHRQNQALISLATALGLDSEAIDQLFVSAASL